MNKQDTSPLHLIASFSLICLIILGVLWEAVLSPVKPGSYWWAIKVIPLLFPLKGVLTKNIYTMQWSSMLILLYFMEGVVRAMGDADTLSRMLAVLEILLCLGFFFASILYVKPYKKIAKAEKKKQEANRLVQ